MPNIIQLSFLQPEDWELMFIISFQDLAAFGHIGRTDIDLPSEKLDKVEELKKELL